MLSRVYGLFIIAMLLFCRRAVADPFHNLNFEDANVSGLGSMSLSAPASSLFPSWTVRFGDFVATTGSYNMSLLAGPVDMLFSSNPVEGNYSIYFNGWTSETSIAQVGDIPSDARSLRFHVRNMGSSSPPAFPLPFALQVAQQNLPLFLLSGSGDNAILGGDVSAWAATTSELRLSVPGFPNLGTGAIDAIEFSPVPIPEPAMLLPLQAISLTALLVTRNRKCDAK